MADNEEADPDLPKASEITLKSPSAASETRSVRLPRPEEAEPSEALPSARDNPRGSPSAGANRSQQEPNEEKVSKSQEELRKSREDEKPNLGQLQRSKATKLHRQCHRRLREMIGKRELRNVELERQQGDLKQRLNVLECSMPAVMVWNMWRMSRGGCVPGLERALRRQFEGPASGEACCPSTPSRHFDCRVREAEAERKQALKRMEDARALWAEKEATLEDRSRKLEEAKRLREDTQLKIGQLSAEVQKLREAAVKVEDDGACEGECEVAECKKKWLEKVPSCASIKSADIECLEKLQQLAENEVYMRRNIAELESREEAYMKTLQQADELWCKLDADATSTVTALQEQLDTKTAANQRMADRICQLEDVIEELRARLGVCRDELQKYVSVIKIEAMVGKEDDFADVLEKEMLVAAPVKDEEVGRVDDVADVEELATLVTEELEEKFIMAVPKLEDVDVEARPDVVDRDLETRPDVADAELEVKPDVEHVAMEVLRRDLIPVDDVQMVIHPDDFIYENERLKQAQDYLAKIDSLSELDKYGDDYICAPGFVCNDLVFSETGLTEEETIALNENRVTPQELLEKYGWEFDEEGMTIRETAEAVELHERLLKTQIAREVKTVEPVEEEEIVAEEVTVEDIEPVRETRPAEEVETVEKVTPMEEVEHAEDIEVEEYESALDIEYVEEAIKPVQEIRLVEDVETEDVKLVKHYEPTDEIKPRPVEEIRLPEDIRPIEETKLAEEIRPTEEIKPKPPVEKIEATEEIKPRPVEYARPIEETKIEPVEKIEATEEIKPKPVEYVRPIEETKIEPVEKIEATEEIKPKPVEDVGPIKEIKAEPVEEIRPTNQSRPVKEISPVKPVEDTKPTERVSPTEPKKIEMEEAPIAKYKEDKIDWDNILVPRKEMLSWQSDVDTIRTTIAECPDCVDVKKEADQLATDMAAYTGTDVKEIAAMPRSREEATVKRPEEKFLEIESEIRAKPDVAEAEVRPKIGEEEVEVEPDAAVELKLELERPPEPPITALEPAVSPQLQEDAILEEKLEETPKEVEKQPEKMPTIPEADEDEIPPMKEEEKIEEEVREPLPKIEEDVPVRVVEEKEIDVEIEEKVEEEPKEEEEEEVKWVPLEEKKLEEVKEVPVAVEEEIDVELLPEEMKVSEEEILIWKVLPVEEEEVICTCPPVPPPPTKKKIEITQTEITRIETVQVVTQTVIDVETQTTPRITRQAQPQLVTITRAIDPDPETVERLLNYERPLKEQFAAMTVTESSHTQKSHISSVHISATETGGPPVNPTVPRSVSPGARGLIPPDHPLSAVLQTLRAEKKQEAERELRSTYYGKKSGELYRDEGKCNCCECGRTMHTPLQTSRAQLEGQAPVFRIVSNLPISGTRISPGTDQPTQHETVCPKCKLEKLQQTLRAQDPLKRTTKKSTRDQEVCTCETEARKALPCREKARRKSVDQICMAKIPKAKPRRMDDSDEDQSVTVGCACSGLIEVKPGVTKKVHCACGDPD
ncbi:titin-like [Frieseomelitta varia]|uniref:titin-like n=1 Tax=Frieseomelitta varia TaxID=561572 RepID=UPI001CB68FA1|nr:titin-like [Frieseomelitta varia]